MIDAYLTSGTSPPRGVPPAWRASSSSERGELWRARKFRRERSTLPTLNLGSRVPTSRALSPCPHAQTRACPHAPTCKKICAAARRGRRRGGGGAGAGAHGYAPHARVKKFRARVKAARLSFKVSRTCIRACVYNIRTCKGGARSLRSTTHRGQKSTSGSRR